MDIVLLSVRAGVAVRGVTPHCPGNMALYNCSVAELQFFADEMRFVQLLS